MWHLIPPNYVIFDTIGTQEEPRREYIRQQAILIDVSMLVLISL